MDKINFHWPTYKNIEDEIENLSKHITFCDKQKNCFSNYIADLILKCASEIESISKELYFHLGGVKLFTKSGKEKTLKFDYDCLSHLESRIFLKDKKIILSNPNFYFSDSSINPFATIFDKEKSKDNYIWNISYQKIKHDKAHSIEYATIENLIYISSALYILNLYFKDKTYKNIGTINNHNFDERCGSKLFSVYTSLCFPINHTLDIITGFRSDQMRENIYLLRYSDEDYKKAFFAIQKTMEERDKKLFQDFLPFAKEKNININDFNYKDYVLRIGHWKFSKNFENLTNIDQKIKKLQNTNEYINFANKPQNITETNFEEYVYKIGTSSYWEKNFKIYETKIDSIEYKTPICAILNK